MAEHRTSLPQYTLAQELSNSITHGAGAVFGIVLAPFLMIKAVATGDPFRIVSSILFLIGLIVCFTISCIYHALARNGGKRILRILDHDMIFLLIAGTYAPYTLVAVRSQNEILAYIIYGLCVVLGILGITLNSVNLEKFKIFSTIDYIVMGWLIGPAIVYVGAAIGWWPGTWMLILGGISYTIGAVLYAIGSKTTQWFHLVFHGFVLVAAVLMALSIYFFVI